MKLSHRLAVVALLTAGSFTLAACAPSVGDAPAASVVAHGHPDLTDDPEGFRDLTEAQWKERLTDDQYYILRQAGTERAFTSPLNDIRHADTPGTFHCAGDDTVLFLTDHKYKSGTGWPSFDRPATDTAIIEEAENDYFQRVEVRCATCNGHLGHVFTDGPRDTTGLRYCINGDALVFRKNASE